MKDFPERLVFVDDEQDLRQAVRMTIEDAGYEGALATCGSGEELLNGMRVLQPELILLDLKMPGMDGMTTLKEIKRLFPLVEVIMLTGHATVDSAVEGLHSGATDYLMKPTDVNDLIKKAEEAFEKRQKLEEKIRVAQTRRFMKSPRQIIKETENP